MNEIIVGLSIAYVFLTTLLLLVLIYSRLHHFLKLLLLIAAIGFYAISYEGWKKIEGWPARVMLPEKFLLHFVVIEEPDDELGSNGNIFMWLSDLYGDQPATMPRAYQLPYSREMHGKLDEAMQQQRNGNLQLGILRPSSQSPESNVNNNKLGQHYLDLEFSKVPDPALPEK